MNVFVNILILCGIYLVELACYQLGIRILFEVRQKSYIWMAVGLVCPVVIGLLPVEATEKSILVIIIVIGVMFLSLEGRGIEKGVELVLTLILLDCMDDIFVYPRNVILDFIGKINVDSWEYLISRCCVMIEVILIYLVRKKLYLYKKGHINSVIYFVTGIIAVSMMFCLTALDHAKIVLNDNEKFVGLCNILNVAINISILLLIIFIVYIKNTNEQMKQLLRSEQILKESQVNYYKQALKKEEDTRKYRHDMMSHLAYVRDNLEKNRLEDAKAYVTDMLGGFEKIQNTYFVTGNEMVDIIMNYFFAMLPEHTEIVIKNKCPIDFNMEDTEICTIFSNVCQNAIEEITENSIENAEIIVAVKKGKAFAEYNIKNSSISSTEQILVSKNGLPKSHKSDKKNHGIGMANAKKAVERNHGSFEWYQAEGYFGVNIILPIKEI